MYAFDEEIWLLLTISIAPVKSMPVTENGGQSCTLKWGNTPVYGFKYDFPFTFLQITHLCKILESSYYVWFEP